MAAILLTPPAAEPLSLADAKAFLRADTGDDDALIAALLGAARQHIEALTRRALLLQTWRLVLDAWPRDGRIVPRIGPLKSLSAARIYDAAGNAHALDVVQFVVDGAGNAIAAPSFALPVPGRAFAGIELDVICGYGAAGDVPAGLIQALRMLLAHWFDNRVTRPDDSRIPADVAALLAPHRLLAL